MKSFKLYNGDVEMQGGKILMVSGNELLRQKTESTLGTNKGEWVLNLEEGIDFMSLLGKKANITLTENKAAKQYYSTAIADVKADMADMKEAENELAKRLEERLEGDDE